MTWLWGKDHDLEVPPGDLRVALGRGARHWMSPPTSFEPDWNAVCGRTTTLLRVHRTIHAAPHARPHPRHRRALPDFPF